MTNRADYAKEWAKREKKKDPEKFKRDACNRVKRYYKRHRVLCLKRAASYRKENQDKVKAATALWFSENKEYRKKYKKEYRRNNKEKIAQYRKDNPDKHRAYKANRRTRQTKAGGSFTEQQWLNLCKKHHNKCLCCNRRRKLTADHVIPVSKGGTSYISNIQPLCGPCNSRKHDNVVDYRKG